MNNRPQKQSMSELKLRRVTEHIQRLRDDLARPRVRVSEAAQSLIRYTRTTKDPLVCIFFLILAQWPACTSESPTGALHPRPLQGVTVNHTRFIAELLPPVQLGHPNPMLTGVFCSSYPPFGVNWPSRKTHSTNRQPEAASV